MCDKIFFALILRSNQFSINLKRVLFDTRLKSDFYTRLSLYRIEQDVKLVWSFDIVEYPKILQPEVFALLIGSETFYARLLRFPVSVVIIYDNWLSRLTEW